MKRTLIAFLALALVVGACTAETRPDPPVDATTRPGTGVRVTGTPVAHALQPFDQCADFLSYVKEHAIEMVGPYGLDYGYGGPVVFEEFAVAAEAADAAGATTAAPARAGDDFSTTNVQEAGVDEPDIVKTDGNRIIALAQQTLYVIDVTGSAPLLTGSLNLENLTVRDMFLAGDRVLLMGTSYGHFLPEPIPLGVDAPEAYYPTETSVLAEVEISDGEPVMERTLELDGRYLNARMVGDSVRIVTSSGPTGLVWEYPEGGGLRAERIAIDKNKEIIQNSTIDNWVPYFVLSDADGTVLAEGNMVECERAHHPADFAGLDMLNVITVDMRRGLGISDSVGVLVSGETVYASTDALYVATPRWIEWWRFESQADAEAEIDEMTTQIHQFDISDPRSTQYIASGSVPGFLLNQFAMSELGGDLRVASTTTPNWWGWGDRESESLVTVLRPEDGELASIGQVGGLGEGEQIFAVRFLGDMGYVVTFRQTDPLYTIDLSDPTDPKTVGELKIRGYSAYLHPLGDDRLLGVGQDATKEGRTLGTQVSVFDVADPANPQRVSKFTLDNGSSTVEYDHRAFLYWPQTALAVVPVQSWSWDEPTGKEEAFFGAIGLELEDGTITELGRIVHPGGESDEGFWDWQAQIQRSLVIGDDLYTVSDKGVLKSDLGSLEKEVWVPFNA